MLPDVDVETVDDEEDNDGNDGASSPGSGMEGMIARMTSLVRLRQRTVANEGKVEGTHVQSTPRFGTAARKHMPRRC